MAQTFEQLTSMSPAEFERILVAGKTPDSADLVGFGLRGWNVFGNPIAAFTGGAVLGVQRFAKGFFQRAAAPVPAVADTTEGFNIKIALERLRQADFEVRSASVA